MSLVPKVVTALLVEVAFFAALLFGAAGTWRWPAGWAFLILFTLAAVVIIAMLARRDPGLLAERMKAYNQKGQPLWDRIFLMVLSFVWIGWLVLMGLDTVRYRWSSMPSWLQAVGAVGYIVANAGMYRVFWENAFLAPVVKLQEDRGQTVVATGPYAIVRHPMYATALLYFISMALLLGSWYGVLVSVFLDLALIFRSTMEDRLLQRELPGYIEYASRVRYRLIPHVW